MSQNSSKSGSFDSGGPKRRHSKSSRESQGDFGPSDSPCDLLAKIIECDEEESPEQAGAPLVPESSGTKIAQAILKEIFNKTTNTVKLKVLKKPQMKSGFVSLSEVLPGFDIDDEVFKAIIFSEKLLISIFDHGHSYPEPVGGLCLDVQAARGGPLKHGDDRKRDEFIMPKFLVHLSSQFDFMGHNGGSRITAWVDRDLQTLEEKRKEYVQMDSVLDQQSLYVVSQDKFYYVRHDKEKDIYYTQKKAKNLICEGSNLILLRYLAITKFVGTFEVTTLYIDGSLCRNIYECKGPSSGVVNDRKLDVCKIYRTVIEECGIEHKCIALMTLYGQILKQEWQMCDHILQVNPLAEIPDEKPSGLERIKLNGEDDLQLLSMYLDAKVTNKKRIRNYMDDHPEINHMLADYVQTILQLKPEDIFEFTAKYFLSFTPDLLPLTEYFRPPSTGGDDDDFDYWKYI